MDKTQQARLLDFIRDALADPAGDASVGGSIARLLGLHLANINEWNHSWVDDLLDIRVELNIGLTEVLAHVVWGADGTTAQWMDPLQALFSLDANGKITRYELRFCDESQPSRPYQLHRRHGTSSDHNWSYRFTQDVAWQASGRPLQPS